MFYCSSSGSDPLSMSKSDFLRGIITEKLSAAAQEILAAVERTVAGYEEEASGFRREIDRQRRQLELLQPQVKLHRGDVEAAERHRLTGNHSDDDEEEEEDPVAISKLIQEDLKDPDYEMPPRSGFSRVQTARRKRTGPTQVSDSQNHLKKPQVKMEAGQHLPSESAATDPVVLKSDETGFHTSFVGAVDGSISSADQHQEQEADQSNTVAMETQVCWNQVVKVEVKQEEGSVAQLTLDPDPTDDDKSGLRTSSPEGESDPGGDALSVSSTSELDDLESDDDDDSSDSSSDTDESLDESVNNNQDVEPKTRRKTDKLTCRVCGTWYRQLGSLISHIWNHVNEPHGVCGVCGEKFESVEALKQHLPSHKKGYSCWICGKYLLSSVTLNRHIAKHVTDAPMSQVAETRIKCNVCSKTFSTMSALNGHSRVHLEKRPARCHLCPKSFDMKSDLVAHTKGHGGVYGNASMGTLGYSCKLCGKTFALETSLKTHEKTHTTSDCPFTCQICHKTFQTYQNLMNHTKTHGTDGSFVCSLCNMSFLSKDTLKVHMIVHSNETAYKCSQCGRCFKRLAYLVNHIKTHSAIQQCVCTICGQVSNGQEALEDHMRIHTGEIPVEQNLHLDPWYENTPEEPQGGSLMSGGQESHSII
ncbi:zinc finger protein 79-like isoform X4 [Poecilia formosa]|uniref:zinc finger protein 79-like isoform X4 n=1 Tax=Poecilia formosa TaxID=48698 RepID=UPI000443DFCB|nr:PREDICTED: zinc finger protein 79-like isoform X4 [Poecilia formosa]